MKHFLSLSFTFLFLLSCSTQEKFRQISDFTDDWQFTLADSLANYAVDTPDSSTTWRTLNLPHDWSIEADFSASYPAMPAGGALPGGIGWYRKTFVVDKSLTGKNIFIDFDGVYCNSEVWINGVSVGKRPNGYVSFRYDLTPHLNFGGKNLIAVKVDNSHQPNSRWYSGSGIYRKVRLTVANPVHVAHWGVYATAPVITDEHATLKVVTAIENTAAAVQNARLLTLLVDAAGKKVAQADSSIVIDARGADTTEQFLEVVNPALWSVEQPCLYKIVTRIECDGKLSDEYETSTGIRHFSFDADQGFALNGKPVKIKGVCNHHDLGCLGAAVNVRALERQLEILKTMGCNGIRTSHNPPTPELLDLCDRMGFIVMDEAFDMWQQRKTPYDYAQYFDEWSERDLSDMVCRDRNHPSVFIWSIGNEVYEQWHNLHNDTLLSVKLADVVKKLDPTRPITCGNNQTEPHNHIFRSSATDLIGFNYSTSNWQDSVFHRKYPDRKLIITESTSALMSRGYYEMPSDSVRLRPPRWDIHFTLPVYQNSAYDNVHTPWGSTHETSWRIVKNNAHIAGMYIWTGFDYLGEPTPFGFPSRSSYFGIIDLAGFPKDVYCMYQSEWTDTPVLHVFPHWNWNDSEIIDVWAYFNCAGEVELFLNGKSLGRKTKPQDSFHVSWRVPFQKGKLSAVAYRDGKAVLSREITTAGTPTSIRLTADRQTIKADGHDLSFVTAEVLDDEGNPVPVADNLIEFTADGAGFIAGTDNGNPTDTTSLKRPVRRLFNGKALAVVQAGKKVGVVNLTAKADNLKSAEIKIKVQ
jgi:beta-galactosidase